MNNISVQQLILGTNTLSTSGTGLFINGVPFTGLFYPYTSNPSGYITGVSTGNFITTSQTGQFYPSNNPNGYITGINTGNFITSSMTGNFYPNYNPSGYITGLNTGSFITINQTGIFINTSMTGNFVNTSMLNATGNILSIWTGSSTGIFYPMTGNPSGYLTSSSTGNFVTMGQTGNFITTNQTGAFSALSTQTGSYLFNTSVSSGVNQQFVSFPSNLGNNPYVICSLANSGTEIISVQPSGIVSSGYWAQFSNTIDSNHYTLTTLASLSSQTGLATTVVYQNPILTGQLSFSPTLISGNQSLSNQSFYVFTGSVGIFTLPAISSCVGAFYFIKNKGTSLILSGQGSDTLYLDTSYPTFTVNAGESYIIANDGYNWNIM